MSGSINEVTLLGHLGSDPEIRATNSGGKVASFRMATSETWTDRNSGEKRENTQWHTIVVFQDGLCGVVERFLKKGSKAYVRGQLQTRKWQAQDGSDRWSTEVVLKGFDAKLVLLDARDRAPAREPDAYGSTRTREAAPAGAGQRMSEVMDDDIPF
jgi:single-strand DNA-binding protein